MQVRSLASLSGLRAQHCCGCGIGWQLQLRSTPHLGTSICHWCGLKKKKKKEKRKLWSQASQTLPGTESLRGNPLSSKGTNATLTLCKPLRQSCCHSVCQLSAHVSHSNSVADSKCRNWFGLVWFFHLCNLSSQSSTGYTLDFQINTGVNKCTRSWLSP